MNTPTRRSPRASWLDWVDKRLRHIARNLTHFDLQRPDPEELDAPLTAEELEAELGGVPSDFLFLDFYTRTGLEEALQAYGVWAELREQGLDPVLGVHRLDRHRHVMRIRHGTGGPVLFDLQARFASLTAKESLGEALAGEAVELLCIEWLMMQNPLSPFTPQRPRLPGQRHPGVGLGRKVMTLLEISAQRLGREGLLAFPEHYHNAFLYDRRFRFADPGKEGELKALERALEGLTLAEAAWAVELGLVEDAETGEPVRWRAQEMIDPLSERLVEYFESDAYAAAVARSRDARRYRVDTEATAKVLARVLDGWTPEDEPNDNDQA